MRIQQKTYRLISVVLTAMTLLFAALGLVACNADKDDNLQYIVLNTNSVQKTFNTGDEFTYEGLQVTVYYSDGASEEITDYTVKAPNMSKAGIKEVIVKYGSLRSQYTITVNSGALSGETYKIGAPIVKYVYDKAAVKVKGETALDGNALNFSATADNGYSIAKITANVEGVDVEVYGDDCEYKVPAYELTGNTIVTIAAMPKSVSYSAYKVNYYNRLGGELLYVGSSEEELYTPPEQKYYNFEGWVDENGDKVESLGEAEGDEINLYAKMSINESAVSQAISITVYNDISPIDVTVGIPKDLVEEFAENGDKISAVGLVLTDIKNADYTISKNDIGILDAPTAKGGGYDGEKIKEKVQLSDNAYLYAYGWANYYGTLTIKYNIINLTSRYFTPWLFVGGTPIRGCAELAADDSNILELNVTDLVNAGILSTATYTNEKLLGADNFAEVSVLATSDKTVSVDASSKSIDGYSFTHRLKLVSEGSDEYRSIKIVLKGAAEITVYMMNSSSLGTREVGLWTGPFDPSKDMPIAETQSIGGSDIEKHVYSVNTGGTYYLSSKANGINIYGLTIIPTQSERESGTENSNAMHYVENIPITPNFCTVTVADGVGASTIDDGLTAAYVNQAAKFCRRILTALSLTAIMKT